MIKSNGVLKGVTIGESFSSEDWNGWPQPGISLAARWFGYSSIYRSQLWPHVLVNKLSMGEARLPLKVYEHDALNRPELPEHPYAVLLRQPNPKMGSFVFWRWIIATFDIYGESFAGKIRDRGGRPVQLVPLHPTCMNEETTTADGETVWTFQNSALRITGIRDSDLFHPRTYNPDSTTRGLSRLEPLRRSLEFEDAAQRAQSSFWRRGARPGVTLSHPKTLSDPAAERIKRRWDEVAAGADNTGNTVVLEEGLKAEIITVSAEDAQYVDSRKLHQTESCAVYDVPPPAVHILDKATFSNITEQLRSLYRDTHAPRLNMFEGFLETELRGAVRPGQTEPDFGGDVYAEFLLDEVLRGDFETRAQALKDADYLTIAEKRRIENLPFIDGTDRILVNSTYVPLDQVDELARARAHQAITPTATRTVMGRLSRPTSLADIDVRALTAGLTVADADAVRDLHEIAVAAGDDVAAFRARIRHASKEESR